MTTYVVEPSGTFWRVWCLRMDGTRVRCGPSWATRTEADVECANRRERHALLMSAVQRRAS
jgi:hypothetical protein